MLRIMAYSDEQPTRWDRITGFLLWFGSWPALTAASLPFIIEKCFWEQGCDASQAPRFVAAITLGLVVASAVGWAGYWTMNRIFYRAER